MNDHQRKMARKSGKPAGYRDGGRIRGYQDGGAVGEMRDKAIRDAARSDLFKPKPKDEDAAGMREHSIRDFINGTMPTRKTPARPQSDGKGVVRG